MTNSPFVTIDMKTSSFVRIESGNVPAVKFMQANMRHMDRVCFGDDGLVGSLAIKFDRIEAFKAHANKNGVAVIWKHNGVAA